MRFVDEIEFTIASGAGGPGCVSFHRAKYQPRGGPDGGHGGDGGDLVLQASTDRNTLVDFRRNKRYGAPNGQPGMGKQMTGAKGDDLVLLVPVGTIVYDLETNAMLADLDEPDAEYRLEGGKGGAGNMSFASSTNRTPRYAQPGLPGEERSVRLELKLIADVGLVGYPNAGKSTFISAVTHSKSAIGAHPFTTITPHLGVVKMGDGNSMVLADMPGLIDGAADGHGLGHQFLKHVERCALYLHLVAPEAWDDDPVERFSKLNTELGNYDPELLKRPQIVVLTKCDVLDADERERLLTELAEISGSKVFAVSAVTGDGVPELMGVLWQGLKSLRAAKQAAAATEASG